MALAQTGYSGTPLPSKLGLKDGQRVLFAGLPSDLEELAESCRFSAVERIAGLGDLSVPSERYDVVHAFTRVRAELAGAMETLEKAILPDGTIWVSWPKKASGVATDVTEDVVREQALKRDLVDVKVCAVNSIWSGLKLVIRKDKRNLH